MKALHLIVATFLTAPTASHASTGVDAHVIRCQFSVKPAAPGQPSLTLEGRAVLQGPRKRAHVEAQIGHHRIRVSTELRTSGQTFFRESPQLYSTVELLKAGEESDSAASEFAMYPFGNDIEALNGDILRVACDAL